MPPRSSEDDSDEPAPDGHQEAHHDRAAAELTGLVVDVAERSNEIDDCQVAARRDIQHLDREDPPLLAVARNSPKTGLGDRRQARRRQPAERALAALVRDPGTVQCRVEFRRGDPIANRRQDRRRLGSLAKILVNPYIEAALELEDDETRDRHDGQQGRGRSRKTGAGREAHQRSSPKTKPMPRTVRIWRSTPTASIFLRRYPTKTSTTFVLVSKS